MGVVGRAAGAAVMGAFALVGTASASADSTSCNTAGSIKLSPGLTTTPTVQNVTVKGSLSECVSVESEATEGKLLGHFKTAEASSGATLASRGVGADAEENNLTLKRRPQRGGNTQATVSTEDREGSAPLRGP